MTRHYDKRRTSFVMWCGLSGKKKRFLFIVKSDFKAFQPASVLTEWLTFNTIAAFEVSNFKLKCLMKQEAMNYIVCRDEWPPANELWQDPFGSFELAIGSVSGLLGDGAVLWSLCGMVISQWPLRSSLPMYLFPNGTDAGLRRTLLRSSETRDPWSGRLPVSSLLPEAFSDPRTPNVVCCRKTFWTQSGWLGISQPPTHHHLYHANHQQLLADQGADHPGLVSNPCLHLP